MNHAIHYRHAGRLTIREDSRGFTLIELLISMVLVSILAGIAIPNMYKLSDAINKRNAELQVLHDLRYAQATTVEQGCKGIFTVSSNGKSYTLGCDYVPYSSLSSPVADRTLKVQSLPAGISLSVTAPIYFNSRGQVTDSYGVLITNTIVLKADGVAFSTGTLRPTGFFEFS